MKKIKILLLTIIAATALHTAQGQAQLALGIKGGLNFANISGDAGTTYDGRTGYHAGAFFLAKFGKIGLQPEVIFSQQGTSIKYNGGSLENNFSYVNIPIILKLYLVGGVNLQAGPQFGFLTSAKGDTFDINGNKITQDIKDNVKSSDVSIGLGAGWDLPFGLTIDARYNLGITDNANSGGSAKNQVFQLSAGFKLLKFGK
ncbi:MAG: PorT family protein [Cyclobacteriaceae bacterium]|nr:PorT family protein [Cyclobacteriaceae bacterium]